MRETNLLLKDRRAVTAVEYGLIAALISVAIIGALTLLGAGISHTSITIGNSMTTANSTASSG